MSIEEEAHAALDSIAKKARVHFYKPIQIAEILFHHRTEKGWDLKKVESYRNISKKWRDEVSNKLVGRHSTSSQKYQDDVFNATAMPPRLLAVLGEINKKSGGAVEAYIYEAMQARLASVKQAREYIQHSTVDTFSVLDLVSLFVKTPGLKRSTDKI